MWPFWPAVLKQEDFEFHQGFMVLCFPAHATLVLHSYVSLSFPLLLPSLEKGKLSTKLTCLPNKAETGIER